MPLGLPGANIAELIRSWHPDLRGGSGANTALRDAAQLCRALTTTAGGGDITTVIGQYEHQMREYGYAAVAASAKAEAERGALRNSFLSWLFRRVARA